MEEKEKKNGCPAYWSDLNGVPLYGELWAHLLIVPEEYTRISVRRDLQKILVEMFTNQLNCQLFSEIHVSRRDKSQEVLIFQCITMFRSDQKIVGTWRNAR